MIQTTLVIILIRWELVELIQLMEMYLVEIYLQLAMVKTTIHSGLDLIIMLIWWPLLVIHGDYFGLEMPEQDMVQMVMEDQVIYGEIVEIQMSFVSWVVILQNGQFMVMMEEAGKLGMLLMPRLIEHQYFMIRTTQVIM